MKLINGKISTLVVVILATLFLSLLRENFFLIINGVISGKGSYKANATPPDWLVNSFTPGELALIKWPVTLLFCFTFMLLTRMAIHLTTGNKKDKQLIFLIFGGVFLIGVVLFGLYKLSDNNEVLYDYAHFAFTILQSPVIMLITIPLFRAKELFE